MSNHSQVLNPNETAFNVTDIEALAQSLADKLVAKAPLPTPERFLSIKELSQALGVTRQHIGNLTRKGILRAYGRGTRAVRYRMSEVEAALAAL